MILIKEPNCLICIAIVALQGRRSDEQYYSFRASFVALLLRGSIILLCNSFAIDIVCLSVCLYVSCKRFLETQLQLSNFSLVTPKTLAHVQYRKYGNYCCITKTALFI